MKYIPSILLLIFLAATISCNKYKSLQDDARGNSSIYGRLFLVDTLLGSGIATPLGKQVVFLSYSHDSTVSGNFLVAAKTDSAGYFLFTSLRTDSSYRLLFSDTVKGLVYQADTILKTAGDDSLPLIARPALYNSTGFKYAFIDRANGGFVPGVHLCIFTSSTLANAAAIDTCAGSNYQITADSLGTAALYGIPPGLYYAYIYTNYTALPFNKLDTFTVAIDVPQVIYVTLP